MFSIISNLDFFPNNMTWPKNIVIESMDKRLKKNVWTLTKNVTGKV